MNKLLLALILATILLFAGCTSENESVSIGVISGADGPELTKPVIVTRIIDGDTIELKTGEKVRLIGINAPESTTKHEPFGKEAAEFTKKMLEGKPVRLEKDVSETDQYGRLLRYVWIVNDDDSTITYDSNEDYIRTEMFNARIIIAGYAEPYTFPPDVKYSKMFIKFARHARSVKRGLWSIDPVYGTTRGDLDNKEPILDDNELEKNESKLDKTGGQNDVAYNPPQIEITELNKRAEYIVISNNDQNEIDLTGWKIVSVTGGQTFTFPTGFIIPAGKSIKVGGYDAKNQCNLIWEDGHGIWSNSKSDPAELYDSNGNLLTSH